MDGKMRKTELWYETRYDKSCQRKLAQLTHFFEEIAETMQQRGIAQIELDKIQRLATNGKYFIASSEVIFGKRGKFNAELTVQIVDFQTVELAVTLGNFSHGFNFKVNQTLQEVSDCTDFLWFAHKVFWYAFNAKQRGIRAKTEIKRKLKVFLRKNCHE